MRSFIVGTAGHIDHGKSSLVLALTGTDPDRLKEEKERGITIDLGFAHAPLGPDLVASFIDVPGHERFVKNMLAGSHGVDAALLVVAADESVKPQTREHLHICDLLGIPRGLVAITKSDAADQGTVERAERETRALIRGTFLEGAEIVRVSAKTGAGLDDLRAAIRRLAATTSERGAQGLFRLPVDRVFTMRGFGTVVTGTLVSGGLSVGDDVVVLPSGKTARVRGLQVHGARADRVAAGHRCAVNLASIDVDDIVRGDVLTRGEFRPTWCLDVRIRLLRDAPPLKQGARVRVHAGSAEILGRVRLASSPVAPGGAAFGQIRLESPAVAARLDPIVLRSYSPAETIGGARVLDPIPRARTRAELAALSALADATPETVAGAFVREAGPGGLDRGTLAARLGLTGEAVASLLARVENAALIPVDPPLWLDRAALAGMEDAAVVALKEFHTQDPLAKGMPREELRRRAFRFAAPATFDHVVGALEKKGAAAVKGDLVSLPAHRVSLSGPDAEARSAIESALEASGLAGLDLRRLHATLGLDQRVCERAVRVVTQDRAAERIGDGLLVGRAALDGLKKKMQARFSPGMPVDVAVVKDMVGLTRKHVIPLLEWLDRERVTRRVGDGRVAL